MRSKTGRAGRPEEEEDRKRGKRFGVKGNPPLSGREVKSVTESSKILPLSSGLHWQSQPEGCLRKPMDQCACVSEERRDGEVVITKRFKGPVCMCE